ASLRLLVYLPRPPRAPPSFPTRRSSDLPPVASTRAWRCTGHRPPPTTGTYRSPGATRYQRAERVMHGFSWSSLFSPNRASNFLRSEEHTSELQSRFDLVCRLLLEKKKKQ